MFLYFVSQLDPALSGFIIEIHIEISPRWEIVHDVSIYSRVNLIWHRNSCCFNGPPAVQNAYLFICFASYEIGVLNTTQLHFHHSLLMSAGDYIALITAPFFFFFPFSSQLEEPHLLPWFSEVGAIHQPLALPSYHHAFCTVSMSSCMHILN